ncbi:hypothetical protein WY13_02931 [Clostridium ljungdahlii]|uniref:Uncharacterized protein n=1 Tax=Clostridium ljungdahlii TaxID=1538 RepID=A0A170ND43_9CLOT|nr:hypothetical protein WY13_02931 [Clostridium ljungdahlii]
MIKLNYLEKEDLGKIVEWNAKKADTTSVG